MAGVQPKTQEETKRNVSTASSSRDGVQTFVPLAFDETLVAPTSASASASVSSTKSAADFFLDQIAAVVSDEKKLSDNIMDLIPPIEAPRTQAMTSTAMSMDMPLQPPLDLMMRALSPPTSLLPDFGDVASLSLLGDATTTSSAASIPKMTTVTTAVKRELPVVKPAVAGAMRRKAGAATAASVMPKKQKTDSSKPETVVSPAAAVQPQVRQPFHGTTNPLTGASAASASREKVMKEPQSGDLYECVITKRNGGLGLTLACVDDHVQITGLAPDTPAANSGICVGDTLVAVSGLPVRGLQFSTVIGRLKSTSRNSVVLKLRRNPFRQNAGNSTGLRGTKRPGRGGMTGSDSSNSANVLSSKSVALESRIGGGVGNGLNGSASNASTKSLNGSTSVGIDDLYRSHYEGEEGRGNHAAMLHAHVKTEPINSTYFPTDASILTMGATSTNAVPLSVFAPSSSFPSDSQAGWRVNGEEKDRYYAECRALRHDLGRAMVAQRMQKRETREYTSQLQAVVDRFQKQVREVKLSSPTAKTDAAVYRDEIATLRQQLVEMKYTLAKQQTEMVALQEREARHALPEAQRVKWQLVSYLRKSVLQIDCKKALKWTSDIAVSKSTLASSSFKERLDGVRPHAFALLTKLSNEQPSGSNVDFELDAKMCLELLGWNMREAVVQAGERYIVSVADSIHIKYLQSEEVLVVSWTLCVKACKKDEKSTLSLRNCT